MSKMISALSSRTVWTVMTLIALNLVQVYAGLLTPEQLALANAILGALAAYFRINTKASL